VIGRSAHERVNGLAGVGVETRNAHLKIRELRQKLRDRVAEDEPALLDEHHGGDRGERLGHRVQAKDRVLRHRRAGPRIALAEALEVRDLALARDEDDRTRVPTARNLGLQHLGDTRQPLRGESDVFGFRSRQRIGPDEGREDDTEERGDEGREPGHGEPP